MLKKLMALLAILLVQTNILYAESSDDYTKYRYEEYQVFTYFISGDYIESRLQDSKPIQYFTNLSLLSNRFNLLSGIKLNTLDKLDFSTFQPKSIGYNKALKEIAVSLELSYIDSLYAVAIFDENTLKLKGLYVGFSNFTSDLNYIYGDDYGFINHFEDDKYTTINKTHLSSATALSESSAAYTSKEAINVFNFKENRTTVYIPMSVSGMLGNLQVNRKHHKIWIRALELGHNDGLYIYDPIDKKETALIPIKDEANLHNLVASDNYIFTNITPYKKTQKGLLIDIQQQKVICDDLKVIDAAFAYENNGMLNIISRNTQYSYYVTDDTCQLLNEEKLPFTISLRQNTDTLPNGIFVGDEYLFIDRNGFHKMKLPQVKLDLAKVKEAQEVKSIVRLLKAKFEKRALQKIDALIKQNPEALGTRSLLDAAGIDLDERLSYTTYIYAKKVQHYKHSKTTFDRDFMPAYRTVACFSIWHGYEKEVLPSLIRSMKEVMAQKTMDDPKAVKEHLAIIEAAFFLSIDKDEEAYNLLFDKQPFSDDSIEFVRAINNYKNPLTEKGIAKLAAAMGVSEEKIKGRQGKPYTVSFFFDFDGNKVYKNKSSKTPLKETKKVTEKQNAIQLLD